MKNVNLKIEPFIDSLKYYHKIFNLELKEDKGNNKIKEFEFAIKFFMVFDRTGLVLVNRPIAEFINLSTKFIDRLKMIVMKLQMFNFRNQHFELFFKHLKVFFYLVDSLAFVCITTCQNDSCLNRLYLFFISIIYLNLIGNNLSNPLCLINISKIFEVFYVDSLTNKFQRIIRYILKFRDAHSIKYLYKFKSLIIYDPNNGNKILFDYRKMVYKLEHQKRYNVFHNEKIFSTINGLIIQPVYNNCVIPYEGYSHKLELISTYPRWLIFGKFLRIFNGLNMIEVFSENKLSKITSMYMEYKIELQKDFTEYYKVCSKHCRKLIKAVEMFFFNYFETLLSVVNRYNNPYNELLYFDVDLLRVTDDVLTLKLTQDQLINLLYKRLQMYVNKGKRPSAINENILLEAEESSNNSENNNNNNNNNEGSKINDSNNDEEINQDKQSDDSSVSSEFLKLERTVLFDNIFQASKSIISSFSFQCSESVVTDSEIEGDQLKNVSYILNNNDDKSFISYKGERELFKPYQNITNDKQINLHVQNNSSLPPTINIIVNNNNTQNNNASNNNLIERPSIASNNTISTPSMSKFLASNKNVKLNNKNKRKSRMSMAADVIKTNVKSRENDGAIPSSYMRNGSIFSKRSNSFTESGLYLNQFYSWLSFSKMTLKNKYQILKEIQYKISKDWILYKRNNSLKCLKVKKKFSINSQIPLLNNLNKSSKYSENKSIPDIDKNSIISKTIISTKREINEKSNSNNNLKININDKYDKFSGNISSIEVESRTNKTKREKSSASKSKSKSSFFSIEENNMEEGNDSPERAEEDMDNIFHEYYADKSTNNFVGINENYFSNLNKINVNNLNNIN